MSAEKLPYTGSTFWLSSLEKSPSPVPANFGGLASRLHVRAYPYPNKGYCAGLPGGSNNVCATRDLDPVAEVPGSNYTTSWKTKKSRAGGPGAGDFVPDNSYWQIVTFLDFDGDGQPGDDEDIASRIIKWTSTPSTDQPADGWSLDINWGSNQNIPFVLEDNQSGCFGTARAPTQVECLVDLNQGGTLILETPDGAIILELGAGNDLGLRTVSGEICDQGTIDVDTNTEGTCSDWEVFPPFELTDAPLIDSFLYVCEALLGTLDLTAYVMHMQDELGTQALVPLDQATASSACADAGFLATADDLGTGLHFVLNKIKRAFTPAKLWAGHGSSGSRLSTIRSDFQLVETAQMQAVGGTSFAVAEGGSQTLTAIVKDHADADGGVPVSNADVYVYSEAGTGSSLSCPTTPTDPTANCVDLPLGGGSLPTWAGDGVLVTTGGGGGSPTGLVEVVATLNTTSSEVRMLGCSIAVPGSDTPADGGFAGDAGPCDRDPADVDGPDGYANGIQVGIVDPFMSDGTGVPVWANDLPLVYSLDVCSAPTVNGVLDASDPWAVAAGGNGCIPSTSIASFEVNVGGNIGGGATGPATAQWFATSGRAYLALELPLNSDPFAKNSGKVEVAITFDAGDGSSPGTLDEFDDQIVLIRDKDSQSPTGDVSDRYLKSSCTNGSSACNSDDADLGGTNNAEGAMAWDASTNTLFIELSQVTSGGDATIDPNVTGSIGFILQLGVGNVQQGGTDYPDQSGGTVFQVVNIP